jgi:hypothetical protein
MITKHHHHPTTSNSKTTREILKMEDDVSIQKLVHESMNRLKNRCESDDSEARVHESYS